MEVLKLANTSGIAIKFAVTKVSDIERYLSPAEQGQLADLLSKIEDGRTCDDKPSNIYLVVNTDEPYADQMIDILKAHGHWG